MIRAIFFDVDGTLIHINTHAIPEDVLQALHRLRQKGVLLFLCTGRHMDMLGELTDQFDFDGYLTVSGQYGTFRGETVYSNPIPKQGVHEILEAMEGNGFSGFFLGQEKTYVNRMDAAVEQFIRDFGIAVPPVLNMRRALTEPLYQVIVLLDRAHEGLLLDRTAHVRATRWHPTFLDVFAPDGGKNTGIAAVLRRLNIPLEQAMAFGDGENDIAMLRSVGIGVAMGNADEQVKASADYVTARVEEGGIVSALTHFGLL